MANALDVHAWAEKFWGRVDRTEDCWLWQGAKLRRGYGGVRAGRLVQAHRFAYELTFGPIPDGMCVLHRCDNPPCVRPDHLFLGTKRENSADMVLKGRQATADRSGVRLHPERIRRGELSPSARLRAEQVQAIRTRYAAGGITQAVLAAEFGVHRVHIAKIVTGRAWAMPPAPR